MTWLIAYAFLATHWFQVSFWAYPWRPYTVGSRLTGAACQCLVWPLGVVAFAFLWACGAT